MLGHGRNSRMKYTTYTPYDNRMWPESSAARLLENSNRPIASRSIPITGDIGGGISLTPNKSGSLYTHNSTINTADSAWELDFDWTVDNKSDKNIDYRIYFVVTGGSAYQIGPSVFTADADSETDEAGETVSVTTGGPNGNVTAFIRLVDDATSETIQETDTFALVLPAINITLFHAQYTYAMDAFEEARFAVWFNDQVPTTSPSLSYQLTMYWREVGAGSWNIETNFEGAGQDITTTNDNVQVTHARGTRIAVVGGGATVEAFFELVLQGTSPVQNYTVAGRFPVEASPVTATALTLLDDETIIDSTVPTQLEVEANPDAQTANGYDGFLTEVDMHQLELSFYVDTIGDVPVASQTLIMDGPFWNSDPRSYTFQGLAAGTYKVSHQLVKRYTDNSTDTVQSKIASNYQPTVIASGGGYGTFFDLADHLDTTPATIVENATYTHANCGFDDTNNELEFIDTTAGTGPTWGTAAVDIIPDPNPETWINWVPTWKDDFDMVMDFQFTYHSFPAFGSNDEKTLDIQTTPNDYSQPYHIGCGLYYTGNSNEVKIKPTFMWYDRTNAKGLGVMAHPMFGLISTTYTSNTILGTGDTIFGASATRYTLTWKYRAVDIGSGLYTGTLRHYINGYFQGEWASGEPAVAYDEIYHHRTTNGLRVFSKYFGAKIYEYSLKRTAPHESQDRITAGPTNVTPMATGASTFQVEISGITVNIPATTYNVYVRYNGTVYAATGSAKTAADINSGKVYVDNIPHVGNLDGATATEYEVLFRPSSWDSTAGVENYLGEYLQSDVIAITDIPEEIFTLADDETLPWTPTANKSWQQTTTGDLSKFPQESFDWIFSIDVEALADGMDYNVAFGFGGTTIYDYGTYYGFRNGKQLNDNHFVWYPGGALNLSSNSGSVAGTVALDRVEFVVRYFSGSKTVSREVFINGVNTTFQTNSAITMASGWLDYNGNTLHTYIGHVPVNVKYHSVTVKKLTASSLITLTTGDVKEESPYNGTNDISNALDAGYESTTEWVANSNSGDCWAWFDLGSSKIIDFVRLWQHKEDSGSGEWQVRSRGVKIYMTNDDPGASTGQPTPSTWTLDSWAAGTTDAFTRIMYTDDSGNYQGLSKANYTNIGSGSDYTCGASKVRSATAGYWEFHTDRATLADRIGRYMYLEFTTRNSNKKCSIPKFEVYGR